MRYNVRQDEAYIGAFGKTERGGIDLDEDEFVLDAEFRGADRVVVAIASPIEVPSEDACGVCGCDVPCEHGCCGGGSE